MEKPDQERGSNIFSKLLFLNSLRLYQRGRHQKIEPEELHRLYPCAKSKNLGEALERQWDEEASMIKVLWRCFGTTFLLYGLLQATFDITVTVLGLPYLVGKIVSFFTPGQTDLERKDVLCYVYVLIAVLVAKTVYRSNYAFRVEKLGIEVRTALCSFLYRTILRCGGAGLREVCGGRILTLITKDVQALEMFAVAGNSLWICVLKVLITGVVLYAKVGVACVFGMGCFMLVMPLQIYLGVKIKAMKIAMCKQSDERLQAIQETMSAIRLIKMYTWEKFFVEKIHACRKKEMNAALKMFTVRFVILTVGTVNSEVSLYLILMSYIALGHNINGEIIYFIALVSRHLIHMFGTVFPDVVYKTSEALSAIKRFETSVRAMKLRKEPCRNGVVIPTISANNITVSIRKKTVLKNVTINIQTGLTIVSGPVGSGKSIFLKTLLKEYSPDEGSLTVSGSISYSSQEPWLFPSTIKKNVLFGEQYDIKRYQEVLRVCALTFDLELLKNGDATIVEDGGANLSKGQQSRINLARAVYRKSDIYLLDDPLAGLDAHVGAFVFEECLKKFLKNKIVVLVSHNLGFLKEAPIVFFDNGRVNTTSSLVTTVVEDTEDNTDLMEEEAATLMEKPDRKPFQEQSQWGSVRHKTYNQYVKFGGGIFSLLFVLVSQGGVVGVLNVKDVFVSNWVNREELQFNATSDLVQEHRRIVWIYSSLMLLLLVSAILQSVAMLILSRVASIRIHKRMVEHIIRISTSFFDTNCMGNIMNRFSKDMTAVDEVLPFLLARAFRTTFLLVGSTVVITLVNKIFLVPATVLFVTMVMCRQYTIETSTNLKRLDVITRSPVVGHIAATLDGLITIRAVTAEDAVKDEFDRRQDVHASTSCAFQASNKAFIFILDVVATAFNILVVTRFFVLQEETTSGSVGLVITNAFLMTGGLHLMVAAWTELENQMVSTERTLEYTQLKNEGCQGLELQNWPNEGRVIFEDVYLSYPNSNKYVLNGVNLTVAPGEKIGVVGRTGAGKSSLVSALFRLYDIEGKILIDEVDIKTTSLSSLRSNISIIPQEPLLFAGTVRDNLDPFRHFADDDLWTALTKVGLKKHIASLDLHIGDNFNFSVGQKQMICIARTVLQKNKIVVLDEATSSVDSETEKMIYKTIEENFSGCTILTIAHRLQSVLGSDRIVVLDKGEVVECGRPGELLEDDSSLFYRMVFKAGLITN